MALYTLLTSCQATEHASLLPSRNSYVSSSPLPFQVLRSSPDKLECAQSACVTGAAQSTQFPQASVAYECTTVNALVFHKITEIKCFRFIGQLCISLNGRDIALFLFGFRCISLHLVEMGIDASFLTLDYWLNQRDELGSNCRLFVQIITQLQGRLAGNRRRHLFGVTDGSILDLVIAHLHQWKRYSVKTDHLKSCFSSCGERTPRDL